jgi:hypothetical protein
VLPFADIGSANFVVDKIALTHRSKIERANWAWTKLATASAFAARLPSPARVHRIAIGRR